MKKIAISSWGNTKKDVLLDTSLNLEKGILDIGNLNSYGDSCLPSKILSSNTKSNLTKKTVLSYQMSSKCYLFGTPGKSNVTIAGAIASDTHGKDNDWGGSFYKNIKEIQLSVGGKIFNLSQKENSEIFDATVGGYGLTGTIKNVSLINSEIPLFSEYQTEIETGVGIESLMSSFNTNKGEYWVGWINLLEKKLTWVSKKSVPKNACLDTDIFDQERQFPLGFGFVTYKDMKILKFTNSVYFKLNKKNKTKTLDYRDTFFPLSFLSDTRNISYKRRIVQIQFSVPIRNQHKLEFLIRKLINKQKPLLCSIKKLGFQNNNINLSFFQNGWTVAVDFSHREFNREVIKQFYAELVKYGGKIYLAKDSELDENNFRLMYPEYSEWKSVVKEVDPKNLYQSDLSKRLRLKEW
jgi:hypothetical protein